ncbi:MAG: hypothetical protein HY815_16590 [Candidatus Riflebacteria bacterium]|nr:hypothetical protein [Candidatus Riflebacteria bacterium]
MVPSDLPDLPDVEDKLKKLEAEIDRDRERVKKEREAVEQKALVPVPEPGDEPKAIVAQEAPKELTLAGRFWQSSLQLKVTVGAAGVVGALFLLNNIFTIVFGTAAVAGVWYLSGRYVNKSDRPSPDEEPNKKKE